MDTFAPAALGLPRKTKQKIQNLSIVTKVNGETRQNSSSINMVLSIQKIIASLSSVMTIEVMTSFPSVHQLVLRCQ